MHFELELPIHIITYYLVLLLFFALLRARGQTSTAGMGLN